MYIQIIEINRVDNSAKGTISHTPFTPKNLGKINSPITKKTKVLSKESRAEILPFEKAVNIPDAKILKPERRKPMEKILKPFNAISNKLEPFLANRLMSISEPNEVIRKELAANKLIKIKL